MKATVTVDTTEFHAAMREYLKVTTRTLAEFITSRMFFVLVRAFALLKPQNPQAERNRIRAYLNEPIGERRFDRKTGKKVGKARQAQRVHLIVQARNKASGGKGLYGEAMKEAAAKFRRAAIGSVGYLRSGVAKAIKQVNGHFTQFGFRTKKSGGRDISPNAALVKIAAEYGTALSNVAMHKGARSYTTPARPGFNPTAVADIAWNIKDGQDGRVASVVNPAFQRAYDDETREMQKRLAERMQEDANLFNPTPQRAAA